MQEKNASYKHAERTKATHILLGGNRALEGLVCNFSNIAKMGLLPDNHVDLGDEDFMPSPRLSQTPDAIVFPFSENNALFHDDRLPVYIEYCQKLFDLIDQRQKADERIDQGITLDKERYALEILNLDSFWHLVNALGKHLGLSYESRTASKADITPERPIDPKTGRIEESFWQCHHDFLTVASMPSQEFWRAISQQADLPYKLFPMNEIWSARQTELSSTDHSLRLRLH